MRLAHILTAALGSSLLVLSTATLAQDSAANPACEIQYFTSPEILELLEDPAVIPRSSEYQDFCRLLEQAGAGLLVDMHAGTETERSYGWVAVGLIDLATGIPTDQRATTISLTSDRGPQVRGDLLLDSLFTAMQSVADEPDRYLTSLRDENAEARARFAPR